MHRTERKTDQTRQSEKKTQKTQQKQSLDTAAEFAQTLDVILAGGSWEQLPAERIHSLSGIVGNAALAELMTRRDTGPALAERRLPIGSCDTAPVAGFGIGEPLLTSTPDFGAMSPLGSAQPLAL